MIWPKTDSLASLTGGPPVVFHFLWGVSGDGCFNGKLPFGHRWSVLFFCREYADICLCFVSCASIHPSNHSVKIKMFCGLPMVSCNCNFTHSFIVTYIHTDMHAKYVSFVNCHFIIDALMRCVSTCLNHHFRSTEKTFHPLFDPFFRGWRMACIHIPPTSRWSTLIISEAPLDLNSQAAWSCQPGASILNVSTYVSGCNTLRPCLSEIK